MFTLTIEQIELLLELLAEKHGSGYSDDIKIAQLQTKLSILLSAKMMNQ